MLRSGFHLPRVRGRSLEGRAGCWKLQKLGTGGTCQLDPSRSGAFAKLKAVVCQTWPDPRSPAAGPNLESRGGRGRAPRPSRKGSRIYRRCVTNATVHPELALSPSSQAAHPSILFLSQCQLTLSPRTVAQDRHFRVTVDTFLSLTWTVSGSVPPGPSRNFFSCQVHPDVPPSASKYNSPPRPLCALRLREKLAPPSHPTVTGFMVRLLVQQS
ncbi:uncharacterized protein LOC102155362 [Canis lupus familiaris]|uniref:uncharacterized protein LOC102155362 n=1 Tax=Canis lupus familiaris TaxID=9615 RepID=UPI0003ADDFBF|nr:uncharacterized protein LOC102155362 [Canis lupus familiaris]XP_025303776.3 uncharacterized protein LOC112660465 [Canis lupus dingo]XP_038515793.1 uncharacterized protein LOC102155362 [Canis lupus familiaris]|eukprot:XP_005617843.1 uncharacterized protein LOC102155362 [Canis lupus familiaris]